MGYLFKVIRSGVYKPAGTIEIPFLGAKVGELAQWTLQRRGDDGPDAGLYDLHASFSFLSEALWNDPEYKKVVTLSINPTHHYRLEQADGYATVRNGRGLVIEGVTIWPVQRSR
jgi:hypothetical protein